MKIQSEKSLCRFLGCTTRLVDGQHVCECGQTSIEAKVGRQIPEDFNPEIVKLLLHFQEWMQNEDTFADRPDNYLRRVISYVHKQKAYSHLINPAPLPHAPEVLNLTAEREFRPVQNTSAGIEAGPEHPLTSIGRVIASHLPSNNLAENHEKIQHVPTEIASAILKGFTPEAVFLFPQICAQIIAELKTGFEFKLEHFIKATEQLDLETLKQQAEKMGYGLVRKDVEWKDHCNQHTIDRNGVRITDLQDNESVFLNHLQMPILIEKYNQFKSNE